MEPARISRALNDPTDRKLAPIEIAIQRLRAESGDGHKAASDADRFARALLGVPPAQRRETVPPPSEAVRPNTFYTFCDDEGNPVIALDLNVEVRVLRRTSENVKVLNLNLTAEQFAATQQASDSDDA